MAEITLIDGPMGTLLGQRGVDLTRPGWSAHALRAFPEAVLSVHRDYARAGATVHTANTFRTRQRDLGDDWQELTTVAVQLARKATLNSHRVAASISPLADCYRPDLSPPNPREEHKEFIQYLASQTIDLFLVETFPSPKEALVAVEECVSTSICTWLSLTAGPEADLLTPQDMRQTGREAVDRGIQGILVNCVDAQQSLPFVEAIAELGIPFGAYANAGPLTGGVGWGEHPEGPARYVALARSWIDAGATLIGSCCGTGPHHIDALRRSLITT